MNRSKSQLEQKRMDAALGDVLGNLEQPSLSTGFDGRLEQRLMSEGKAAVRRSARRAMRAYWALTSLVSLMILLTLGSSSPSVTWTILGSLVAALLLGTAPQFLFNSSRRSSLFDLIVDSVR